MNMNPKIAIKNRIAFIDKINVGILVVMWCITIYACTQYYLNNDSNDKLYNTNIFITPIIASLLFILMFYLNKRPHWFNYPIRVTKENAPRVYPRMQQFMKVIMMIMLISFLYDVSKMHLLT